MMSAARLKQLEAGQTSMARKVLDAVPKAEIWSIAQITTELGRVGNNMTRSVVEGCLRTLVEAGLVQELQGGFRRVAARPEPQPVASTTIKLASVPTQEAPVQTPMEKLVVLAADLRSLAAEAESMAVRVEELGVELDDKLKAVDEEGATFRQLKVLLNKIK